MPNGAKADELASHSRSRQIPWIRHQLAAGRRLLDRRRPVRRLGKDRASPQQDGGHVTREGSGTAQGTGTGPPDGGIIGCVATDAAGLWDERQQCLDALPAAARVGAVAVFGCFAPDGPGQCSGLPVARYEPPQLATVLGRNWNLLGSAREEHATPAGSIQPFTWTVFRRIT